MIVCFLSVFPASFLSGSFRRLGLVNRLACCFFFSSSTSFWSIPADQINTEPCSFLGYNWVAASCSSTKKSSKVDVARGVREGVKGCMLQIGHTKKTTNQMLGKKKKSKKYSSLWEKFLTYQTAVYQLWGLCLDPQMRVQLVRPVKQLVFQQKGQLY